MDPLKVVEQEACVPEFVHRVRRLGLVVAGVGSAVLGLVVAWVLVQPGMIGSVGTWALVAILGLLVLPGVVFMAWSMDVRAAARQAARRRTLEAQCEIEPPPALAHSATWREAGRAASRPGESAESRPHRAPARAGARA